MILENGEIPVKNACPQCYQPPVFYVVSALIGGFSLKAGLDPIYMLKLIQFSCCLYGILTLYVIYKILTKINMSDYARVIAFGMVCFLPRHIYMSAMASNDSISYLFVSLCVYLIIRALENNLNIFFSILTCITISVALFIKYTNYILLPTVAILIIILIKLKTFDKRQTLRFSILSFGLPAIFITIYALFNYSIYGSFLPDNINAALFLKQPKDAGGISFFSFKPWSSMEQPFLAPGNLSSFWTLMFSGMWFDIDAMFIRFFDNKEALWYPYYDWLSGSASFPNLNLLVNNSTSYFGSLLIGLGTLPLIISFVGLLSSVKNGIGSFVAKSYESIIEWCKINIFLFLVLFNMIMIIAFTIKRPLYSSIKSSYILNSLSAYSIFFGYGISTFEKFTAGKKLLTSLFSIIFIIFVVHILYIVYHVGILNL